MAENVTADEVLTVCREAAGAQLTQINLFDVYQGAGIAEGMKSLAISLILQDNEKRYDEEISAVVDTVLSALKEKLNAYLRD